MYIKKKKGISQEEFNHYWSYEHGPLVSPVCKKYGFLRYTQVSDDVPWSYMQWCRAMDWFDGGRVDEHPYSITRTRLSKTTASLPGRN